MHSPHMESFISTSYLKLDLETLDEPCCPTRHSPHLTSGRYILDCLDVESFDALHEELEFDMRRKDEIIDDNLDIKGEMVSCPQIINDSQNDIPKNDVTSHRNDSSRIDNGHVVGDLRVDSDIKRQIATRYGTDIFTPPVTGRPQVSMNTGQGINPLIDFSKLSSIATMNTAICHRHHHRRPAVAIRFNKTYLNRKYHDPKVILSTMDDLPSPVDNDLILENNPIKRSPTPITERILKGEFDIL